MELDREARDTWFGGEEKAVAEFGGNCEVFKHFWLKNLEKMWTTLMKDTEIFRIYRRSWTYVKMDNLGNNILLFVYHAVFQSLKQIIQNKMSQVLR